jgi:DNA-binding SARP family transcriptional activator/tetratricopeptide (TPR) repeat protein
MLGFPRARPVGVLMADRSAACHVRVRLLGTFRVSAGGCDIRAAWPGRRPAELVQLLALAEHHRLTREQVIETLWPHLEPSAGAASLRKAAHHARRALGRQDAVVLRGGLVMLFPGCRVDTDAAHFEQAARRALRTRDPTACEQALRAYSGTLLPDARYEEWAQAHRDHLRALHLELLRLGRQWERLIEEDPSDEAAYQELMSAALAGGNRHAAIRWYGRLRTSLQRELGLPPSPQSQALYEACIAGMGTTPAPFTGRQPELARAAAALRAAEQGELAALVVRGPPGIGKTALCRQVSAAARQRSWLVLTVTATTAGPPYAPLSSAVEQVLGHDRAVLASLPGEVRATLSKLTSPAAPAHAPPGGLTRHLVIGAVRRLLVAYGNARKAAGVMLAVDDAHLAGDAATDACLQLALAAGGLPLLAVLACRPEASRPELTRGVAELERAGRSVVIDLGPLPDEDVIALVAAACPVSPGSEALAALAGMAQGNPFFALELARNAGPGQGLPAASSAWDAVTARFLDLDEASAAILRRLALAGEEIDPAGVLTLTGLPEPEAFALLDTALAAGALTVSGSGYRFRHELVRQALIGQVPPHHRFALHRDLARRLTAAGAAPAVIARHWLDGRRPAEAVSWLLAAARQAAGLGAFADALGHLEPLLRHAPGHAEALTLRAQALDALGDSRAPAAYEAAAELAGEPEAHELRAKQALAQLKLGDPGGALQTLADASPTTPAGRLARALTISGTAAIGFGDPGAATVMAAESRRLAFRLRDPGALMEASWAQALAAHSRGDLRGSLWADLRDTCALPELAIRVFDGQLCVTQRLLYGALPYSEVIAFADSLAREAERLGAARGLGFARTLRGEAELLSGRLDEADSDLAAAARINRSIGAPTGEALALQRRAEAALYQGRQGDATALLEDALAVARESRAGFHLLDRIYGTRIAAARPGSRLALVEEAERAIRGPAETCPGCRITLAVPAAIAAAQAGDSGRANHYAQAAATLARGVMHLPGWDAAVEEVRGHLARLAEDPVTAAAHFRAAAAGFRTAGQPLDEARCTAEAAFPR